MRNHLLDLSLILGGAALGAAVFGIIALILLAVSGLVFKGIRMVMK